MKWPLASILWLGWYPIGYCLGWREPGRAAHLERYVLRPKYRTYQTLVALIRTWDQACRRRGITMTTTRIWIGGDRSLAPLMKRDHWYGPQRQGEFDWYWRAIK